MFCECGRLFDRVLSAWVGVDFGCDDCVFARDGVVTGPMLSREKKSGNMVLFPPTSWVSRVGLEDPSAGSVGVRHHSDFVTVGVTVSPVGCMGWYRFQYWVVAVLAA